MKRSVLFGFIFFILAHINFAQDTPEQSSAKTVSTDTTYTLFLIGDAGEPTFNQKFPLYRLLQQQLKQRGENSGIVYLGDNIYPKGLPAEDEFNRDLAESILKAQLDLVKDHKGQVVFIPGNHDWDRSGRKGWRRILEQAEYIHTYLEREDVLLPSGGCPGPVEVQLNDEVTLVVIDSQWWLHPWDKPVEDSDCDTKSESAILLELEDILLRNEDKQIIVVSHHPIYSFGSHGGRYTWRSHVFSLTDLNKKLYIPLPFIGSIYPLYRRYLGSMQDLAHPVYKQMSNRLIEVFKKHPNLIHAAGHEHSLQYTLSDSIHYIVSGAGIKTDYVGSGPGNKFAIQRTGYARIDYLGSGDVWLSFWTAQEGKQEGEMVYKTKLLTRPVDHTVTPAHFGPVPDYSDSTVTVYASDQYRAGKFKQIMQGENYRQEWQQPIKVPVFDIGKIEGGLTILKRGGGQQTRSLRLENPEGEQFILRSIEKFSEGALNPQLRGTVAADLVQDIISASHPYAALVVPSLASAAGIYHTNPKVYYVPDDPRFGKYREAFANSLCLFEERPSGDGSHITNIKGAEKIQSTSKLLEKLQEDNDNRVDEQMLLKARLFDMIIGDWDRHDDQWRWARFEEKEGKEDVKTFRPVPRDRDMVFFINQGIIPKIASRKWLMPKIQGFDSDIRDIEGFNHNARYFDRTFLTNTSLEDWLAMADSLKQSLSDSVIESAIKQWPVNIFKHSGDKIIATLKARRDKIDQFAKEYYKLLAKEVDIVGSNKQELFEVVRQDDEHTLVRVSKISKKGNVKQVLFERTFRTSQTREVRLYGLGGEDEFQLSGEVNKGISIRIIGGRGDDKITDQSRVRHDFRRQTVVYDTKKGTALNLGKEAKARLSDNPTVHTYNRKSFRKDQTSPQLLFEYNRDDGMFLGTGAVLTTHGFRKEPFASQHRISGRYAFGTSSYHFRYQGDFTDLLGSTDLRLNLDVKEPRYVSNFFGLGNQTSLSMEQPLNIDFYRYQLHQVYADVMLKRRLGAYHQVLFGPTFNTIKIEASPFMAGQLQNGPGAAFNTERRKYLGAAVIYEIEKRDSRTLPTAGVYWTNQASFSKGLTNGSKDVGTLSSSLSLYWSLTASATVTIANRFGLARTFGDFEFFQGQFLSGNDNLRGYRKDRFVGRSTLYNNTEVRIRLYTFSSYIIPAQMGLLGFHDVGRVWLQDERSNRWHRGVGGGLWFSPFNDVVITAMYSFTREGSLPLIRLGFLF